MYDKSIRRKKNTNIYIYKYRKRNKLKNKIEKKNGKNITKNLENFVKLNVYVY